MHENSQVRKTSLFDRLRAFIHKLMLRVEEHFNLNSKGQLVLIGPDNTPIDMNGVVVLGRGETLGLSWDKRNHDGLHPNDVGVDPGQIASPCIVPAGVTLQGTQIPSADYDSIGYDPVLRNLPRGGILSLAKAVGDGNLMTFTNLSLPPGSGVQALRREKVVYDSNSPAGRINMFGGAVVTFPDRRQTEIEGFCYVTPFGGTHIDSANAAHQIDPKTTGRPRWPGSLN